MFEVYTSNLSIFMFALWACLTAYLAWYLTKAKRFSPITPVEARQLWAIHRLDTHCDGKKWRRVKNGKETVGFQCECGYTHVQERPLVGHTPTTLGAAQVSAFDQLHTSHKSA